MKNPNPPGGTVTPVPAWFIAMCHTPEVLFELVVQEAVRNGYRISGEWDEQNDIPAISPTH